MEYEYNDYENSVEACKHDLKLLMQVKSIKASIKERLELKLEEAKKEINTFRLSDFPNIENMKKLSEKVNRDNEIETEFNKKILVTIGEMLNSAIRTGTKDVIKQTYDMIQGWVDKK